MSTASPPPVEVLVRADAGPQLGTGHVMRCLSLADELTERGARVTFATHSPATLIERIRSCGHDVVELGATGRLSDTETSHVWNDLVQTADARATAESVDREFDIVIVDHYGLSAAWESHFAGRCRVVAIDDLANRSHDADVLTDPNWYGPGSHSRYDRHVRSETVQLLGPRYAILQRPYRRIVRTQDAASPPRRIVVSFGGTDPGGETSKVLEAIGDPRFEEIHVDVIVGSSTGISERVDALVAERPGTHLHVAVPSLAPFLASADLAFGASGAATWERMAAGVPAIVTTVAPHQSGVTKALHDAGVTLWLGTIDETRPETYRRALVDGLTASVGWAPRIVDGFGAGRLAEVLIPSRPSDLTIRPVESADAGAAIGLRAEASGRTDSADGLLDGPDAWRSGEQWFDHLLAQPAGARTIEARGVPVALRIADTSDVWIQRCIIDADLRRSIRALAAS